VPPGSRAGTSVTTGSGWSTERTALLTG
jgi:hypothetical protein